MVLLHAVQSVGSYTVNYSVFTEAVDPIGLVSAKSKVSQVRTFGSVTFTLGTKW